MGAAQGRQFIRWWKLYLRTSDGKQLLDVSEQRIRFEVRASDGETPNTLRARIYNLSKHTANGVFQAVAATTAPSGVAKNAMTVHLEAGYQDSNTKGLIFQGDFVQARLGAEDNKDTYLDVFAADGDLAYTTSTINQSFPKGTTDAQILVQLAQAMNLPQAKSNDGLLSTAGILPRGQTLYGMARNYMRGLAENNNCRWSIQNGHIVLIPDDGYLPGEAVVINSQTGMIGVPEQTQNGIFVRCYLNPLIKIGGLVQLDSSDIAQSARNGLIGFSNYKELQYNATVTPGAGFYRVLVAQHFGDTRGNDWVTELTCLAVDQSAGSSGKPAVQG